MHRCNGWLAHSKNILSTSDTCHTIPHSRQYTAIADTSNSFCDWDFRAGFHRASPRGRIVKSIRFSRTHDLTYTLHRPAVLSVIQVAAPDASTPPNGWTCINSSI